MKKLYIPIILFIGLGINLAAQEKSRKELQGDKYAFRYSYEKAIDSYTHVKHLTVDGQRNLAESYHNLDQNVQSEVVYSKLITETTGVLPEDYYNYAMILKINGKYDESNKSMDKFNELKPSDLRAKSYMANKGNFQNLLKDDGKYKLVHMDVNTDDEDFGTTFYKDKIVFSSTRSHAKMVKRRFNWNGKPFLNMYVSEVKESQLKDPETFDKSLNGKYHDGPAAFSKDGTFMAFTKNTFHDKTKDKIVELQICFSNYKDGKWSTPEEFAFNNEAYSVGQPSLSSDGNTMYFTSDMPGGFGGSDIYKTTRTGKGEWSKPENLGDKINTEGDEMFPFIQDSSKAFMFSSNGHFGLGGQDIFVCALNGNSFERLYNAGSPLNTQYDDFAAIINDQNKGYFSSNRTGGSGDDDIYTVDFLKGLNLGKKINGFAKDKDGKIISGTFITLLDDKSKILDTLTTKEDGAFSFLADSDKNFKLTGKKINYIDGDSITNTFGKEEIVKADVILLTKEETITKKIQVGSDLGKILEFTPIYFDLDKSNIRPDAETALNKIVKIMNEHPDMIVELGAHTDCRESKEYNQLLSERRAKASVAFIQKRITKPSRITGKGYGKTKLVNGCSCDGDKVSDCSEEEHQKNRRTEFIIIKK
jgi:outer membrane protein OmpA-like peptidoglycan-associated protein/tetratricopeptide (TPR) repeat protein